MLPTGPIRRYFTHLARGLEKASLDPRPHQEAALRRLVAGNGASVIGRKYGLAKVRNTEDARRLPVTHWDLLQPEIAPLYTLGADASGQFGRSSLLYLAESSGSTGVPKRYPVTREFLNSYRRTSLLMTASAYYTTGEWQNLARGKRLLLAARPELGVSPGGLRVGYMSGIMAARTPRWMRRSILPSVDLLCEESWERKMDLILDQARHEDVRLIAGVPLLTMTFTERALARYGVASLHEVWPELRAFLFGGVTLTPRAREFFLKTWRGGASDLHFFEIYAATEGQFGHTFDPSWPGMVFNPFENFFQFLPESGNGPFLQLHELEAGRRYAIHLTTPGGLVNYRIGDWIEILSVRPLTFRVAGRDREELSIATEKITPDQVEKALGYLARDTGQIVDEYVVWLEEGKPASLVVGISSPTAPGIGPGLRADVLAGAFDGALTGVNAFYGDLRRHDQVYGPPRMLEIPHALFSAYRRNNLGRGQFKGKRLFRSREAFEQEFGIARGGKD